MHLIKSVLVVAAAILFAAVPAESQCSNECPKGYLAVNGVCTRYGCRDGYYFETATACDCVPYYLATANGYPNSCGSSYSCTRWTCLADNLDCRCLTAVC
ncbi:uncharacterized protein BJ171DRAFT_599773 [Polychytrium aggregatum]|uniref:uncharacterized protein n=1 Tax=Polychytrium aggregatum TaxID=110093 RepID=UPI0022FF20B7|nr:uncharacterized protein BJ171DRAFT_599773 [Polychytrium aggregatum]KAI9203874.1 hypothetical protein BJ171DRAFT_599773 [Polychytrium aggregatum]